jgi:ubiquinone biosynthesis protein COQ4
MSMMAAAFGPLRLKSGERRRRVLRDWVPWALRAGAEARCLIGVRWEERWEMPLDELKKEFEIREMPMSWEEWNMRNK